MYETRRMLHTIGLLCMGTLFLVAVPLLGAMADDFVEIVAGVPAEGPEAGSDAAPVGAVETVKAVEAPTGDGEGTGTGSGSDGGPAEMPWEILGFVAASLVVAGGAGVGGSAVYRSRRARRETAGALADRWTQATTRHDQVKDEYAGIRLDPVAALDHMALWDITDEFTERFTTAMGAANDLRSVQGDRVPREERTVTAYAAAVEKCAARWHAARTHARQHGLDVLAKTDRSTAAQARKLLVMSTNPAASEAERALAAEKANGLLDRLRDIAFPDETRQAIMAPAYLQITAGPTVGEGVAEQPSTGQRTGRVFAF